jgi:hypothetical protein
MKTVRNYLKNWGRVTVGTPKEIVLEVNKDGRFRIRRLGIRKWGPYLSKQGLVFQIVSIQLDQLSKAEHKELEAKIKAEEKSNET